MHALSITDPTFNFTLTCRSPALTGNYYSDYQLFLYQTITERREQGMTFDAIAEWLNNGGYLTVRGKTVQRCSRPFNLKKEISKGGVFETRASTSLVRLQHGGCR